MLDILSTKFIYDASYKCMVGFERCSNSTTTPFRILIYLKIYINLYISSFFLYILLIQFNLKLCIKFIKYIIKSSLYFPP